MYYYEIVDKYQSSIEKPLTSYGSAEDALNAAKDSMAARFFQDWPAEVRVYEIPPGGYIDQGSIVSWQTLWQEDVKQHALKHIEEANRPALTDVVLRARENHESLEDRYMRGLMTPTEYAKAENDIWALAVYEIGNIEARGG